MLFSSKINSKKDVDRADQYLIYCCSEENCKMVGKGGTVSAKLCALQRIFCVQDTKHTQISEV